MSAVSPHRPPSLGVLIGAIKDCADRLGQAAELHKQTRQRLEQVEELSGDEIREVRRSLWQPRLQNNNNLGFTMMLPIKCPHHDAIQ